MLLPEIESVSEQKKNTRLLMNVKNVTELTVSLRTSSRNCEEDEQAEQEGAHGRRKSEERHGKAPTNPFSLENFPFACSAELSRGIQSFTQNPGTNRANSFEEGGKIREYNISLY
jgi:hypothetical protein